MTPGPELSYEPNLDGPGAVAALDPGPYIPALWFDANGCGPSDLALQLHPLGADLDGAIPATLGLRIRSGTATHGLIYGSAGELIDSGFMMHRSQAEELHRQLGAWLAETPAQSKEIP